VQQALAELGSVTVWTDEDIGDVSCVYGVEGLGAQGATVFVSTVLPYAAVLESQAGRHLRFASAEDTGWTGSVVRCLTNRGFYVLPEATCRAKRSKPRWPDGPRPSYFEDLFQDEFGPPEDWSWVGDAESAEGRPIRP
jgi:hypothetical protein